MSERTRTDPAVESQVLLKSARRCCLCFHVNQDFDVKLGQIAHLDHDPSNGSEANLAYLCMEHHSLYDSRTSQHKNFTFREVVAARDALYAYVQQVKGGTQPKTSPASLQSGGVNFGIGTNVNVYGDVVGGHQAAGVQTQKLHERGEELYGMIDKWLNGLADNYLNLSFVMQGKLTYNQYMDIMIKKGEAPYDFSRIELLIDLDFPALRIDYDNVIEARTALNRIATAHKHAYSDGDIDGTKFLQSYVAAQKSIEALGSTLKKRLVQIIQSEF
jgi:hypothetical protein